MKSIFENRLDVMMRPARIQIVHSTVENEKWGIFRSERSDLSKLLVYEINIKNSYNHYNAVLVDQQ